MKPAVVGSPLKPTTLDVLRTIGLVRQSRQMLEPNMCASFFPQHGLRRSIADAPPSELAAERQSVALPLNDGSNAMQYRLYFMNRRNGHIERIEEFDASSDEAAILHGRKHEGDNPLEIWSGCNKVGRIEALDLTSQLLGRRQIKRERLQQEIEEAYPDERTG